MLSLLLCSILNFLEPYEAKEVWIYKDYEERIIMVFHGHIFEIKEVGHNEICPCMDYNET